MKKIFVSLFLFMQFAAYAQFVGTPQVIIPFPHPTSNGTAIVSGYTCNTGSTGTMTAGVAVSGVTQTITATVTTAGTYNISSTTNGVTFAATGTFAGTGAQDILLTATGTPTAVGSNTFTLNNTPNCSFSRIALINTTSNGSAVVSGYNCLFASTGTMTVGVAVSGVTQTITATVTTVGTYNISTTANGVTFQGTGSFSGTGPQTIVLTATGTPIANGPTNFILNTSPNCSFSRNMVGNNTSNGTAIVSSYTPSTASGTMTAGIPVSSVTQTITANVTTVGTYNISTNANGVTFVGTGTFTGTGDQPIVLTAIGTPSIITNSTFTLNTTPNTSFSRNTNVNPSSNGTAAVSGYTCATASVGTMTVGVPVSAVTQNITATVTTAGTYSISTEANGVTFAASGTFAGTGNQVIVLLATGTPIAATSSPYSYGLNTSPTCSFTRAVIDPSSNGTAVLSNFRCNTASPGTMTVGVPVSSVTQTITVDVNTAGTYNISTGAVNGVTFAWSGSFAAAGNGQTVVLTATGTPIAAGDHNFTLNTTPNCNFSRTTNDASSNGTALFSTYECNTAIAGTLTAGSVVAGVTQTIRVNVERAGTYNLSTNTVNGVTFTGSGSLSVGNGQTILLTATGTPFVNGTNSFTLNTTPNCSFDRTTTGGSATSNGTAVLSGTPNCAQGTAGTLKTGVLASGTGVTQTITATVGTVGTYSISTTANGVTFAASGTFTSTGSQNILLNATGTPISAAASPYTYTLNISPNCSFTRTVIDPSTNGTGVVSSYDCSTASAGTLNVGTTTTGMGVTQTITANVTRAGSYSISTTANGVTFAASGTFAGTGAQTIVLTATGTPTALGTNSFTLNTTPNCTFSRTTIGLASSNGTAVLSNFRCNTASAGTMTVGVAVSGVTQTITVDVATAGTYSISTGAVNGVTFTGSGTVTSGSGKTIVLTAAGTPTAIGDNTFPLNTTPNCSFDRTTVINPSSNGTAQISAFTCTTASAGTMIIGVPVSGVTQTITATVTTAGTYNISTTSNGVTFAGSGIIASTGSIVLNATGTPTALGSNTFTLNTTPNCNFSRTTINASSNGTAVVAGYDCSTASAGTLTTGLAVSGVTQIITANVSTAGTYAISTTSNGVTFAASGTFAGTGAQTIVLIATGTPTASGTFTLNTTPNCFFNRSVGPIILDIINPATGKTWLDRNLGASNRATTSNQTNAYGDFYQWGRLSDGHQAMVVLETSMTNTTTTQANTDVPSDANFIISSTDWRSTTNNNLWQGLNGINNPCPSGYRIPTASEFEAERLTWSSNNANGGLNALIRLPMPGFRRGADAYYDYIGSFGAYWTSTISGGVPVRFDIFSNGANTSTVSAGFDRPNSNRAEGYSVRCIKGDETSGGTAVVSSYTVGAGTGTLSVGVAVTGVSQSITANVSTVGTYDISAIANGVTFSATGTFAGTGNQTITLTATGTPTFGATNTFILNTNPSCIFSRTTSGSASSNGTAVVSAYTCGSGTGNLSAGLPVLGVTQTITATVTTVGNYSISAIANGVTFAANGTFASTGSQNIVLTATGTPTATGTHSFTLNTNPNCNFDRTTNNGSTNGTAVVSSYNCSTASAGSLTAGVGVSGVTQTITANVTTIGTYDILTSSYGVTFAASGSFSATGPQTIVLTASGTPIGSGTFTLNTTPNCYFNRSVVTTAVDVLNPVTGKVWMDRNLGAAQVATSTSDENAYGDWYQWGRLTDGHQSRSSYTTTTLSSTDVPANSNYIIVQSLPYNWRSTQNNNLWQGLNGINNPCPSGYRIPLSTELAAELASWTSGGGMGAFASPLKLPSPGDRLGTTGFPWVVGTHGRYWSSDVNGSSTDALRLIYSSNFASMVSSPLGYQSNGFSVRCIKGDATSGGTAVVSAYDCSTASAGTMTAGVAVSGVTQTITATVTSIGTYEIFTTTSNGVYFSGAGTFTGTGPQTILLTAMGTPTGSGVYTLGTSSTCTFSRSVATTVVDVTSPATGAVWMDRNLGASRAATSITDVSSYGELYQWGRSSDGHQSRTSLTTNNLSSSDVPGNSNFILATSDWRNPENNTLWQNVNGTNNPCPTGYRLPTQTELNNELNSWNKKRADGGFESILKLPTAGYRKTDGILTSAGTTSYYWTSTISTNQSRRLILTVDGQSTFDAVRGLGMSVRCIKGNSSSGGTAVVAGYTTATTSNWAVTPGTALPAGTITQTITANVTTAGTYNITAFPANVFFAMDPTGVIFRGSGTFADTGAQTITLTAEGTPTATSMPFTLNTTPNVSFTRLNTVTSSTSNGTAVISAFSASTTAQGTMTAGVPVSGVTQTFTANVTVAGTYYFSAKTNGVTFAGSGSFAAAGNGQTVVLTASGTPVASPVTSSFTFISSIASNKTFTRTVFSPTSNGTALVSAYTSTGSTGIMTPGTSTTGAGVTQTITATVTTDGTYSISTTANGVTFASSGASFGGTGARTIVLTATETPTAAGTNSYTLNTTPNCSFSRNGFVTVTGVYANVNGVTKDFMTHNLGANTALNPFTYVEGNTDGSGGTLGYLYQWGRQTDGHELRNSATQAGPVSAPVANKFITFSAGNPGDWISPKNDNLWGDGTAGADPAKATNDPCPTGFKVPSQAQWGGLFRGGTTSGAPGTATQNTWTWTGNGYMIGSNLYLPAGGIRTVEAGELGTLGTTGRYWSSTVSTEVTSAWNLRMDSDLISPAHSSYRGGAMSIRCIAE